MRKNKVILPIKRYFNAPEEELNSLMELNTTQNLLRENDRNIILNVSELYNKERNQSIKYKIYGKIKMIFSNEYSGTTQYDYLKNNLYQLGVGEAGGDTGFIPYNEFALLREDVLREVNQIQSGNGVTEYVPNIDLTTQFTEHTTITSVDAPYTNWNLYLSYVFTSDTQFQMSYTLPNQETYSFKAEDGIPFVVDSDDRYYILSSPVEHGMSKGEYVILNNMSLSLNSIIEKTFYIDDVGNETYNSEKYIIKILKSEFKDTITLIDDTVVFGKRCLNKNDINNTTSSYYVHKHKTLTSTDDYLMDKIGFESSIWEDEKKLLFENSAGENDFLVVKNKMESVLYDFKKPFYLSGITNNLGYTPTEVYLSIIFRNKNGYFDYPPKVGYKFNFHDTWIDQHFDGSSSQENTISFDTFTKNKDSETYNFKSGNELEKGTELYGAFVEYNDFEFKERIISESFHKLNHPVDIFDHSQNNPSNYSGASETNMVGIYFQPHYRIKLRELSPYIETSKISEIFDLPENVKYYDNEKLWKWRDLYEHGFIDDDGFGTDFPFVNGIHYVIKNINLYLRNEKSYSNKQNGITSFLLKNFNC
jgi:hypothetical protein